MTILKSTYQIINDPWSIIEDAPIKTKPPKWDNDVPLTFDDVVMWEQVYHQPGNIGIYVAHSPQEEFYVVVHDLFSKEKAGVKVFYGESAVKDILSLTEKLGIYLEQSWLQV